ncbi:peptide-methionine (S)-S-oxide reductase [Komagataeibacter rhaeticus]|uniref:Peptide methionine sulfoxide reductase MsrA n=1 Tax=Komagataeibacter rhaeticus TaxID=215221 RepID=A0A181C903_9PROT|nr:peptide-methionine (S)-S-oxide reductase MsrA [Komagataeibacter rhaeticus]ATU72213.1 peptide-methionine (S)-S-oxide reductase [Komagataeibacter xylinus]EGG75238.1 Peptide methionine sulfoxide reductase msrA [Gluconacetobacter sp. SXCC-1]KDU97179.1 methionine sulfoxide reductase A [Komagataeibacter rhaeticus AF1]MBL7241419.1 peptide-methionine (S)-S-oxide reductase MsrA [Komagataeibacter rhaeticus]PYD53502.1 peptide-methionine (S)-S-oxide reductase [Komagataeibacter rhaeticus]
MTGQALETLVLGGGCFWCIEAPFRELRGVQAIEPGYAGGQTPNPTYEQVCTGRTGHAEVVRVTFDPAELSCADLLRIFFVMHDPTTLNRQGNDVGTQYRSAIFWQDAQQEKTACAIRDEIAAAGVWPNPLVTEIVKLDHFWPAEDYHRDYFARNPGNPYCNAVIPPKIAKMRRLFRDRLVDTAG